MERKSDQFWQGFGGPENPWPRLLKDYESTQALLTSEPSATDRPTDRPIKEGSELTKMGWKWAKKWSVLARVWRSRESLAEVAQRLWEYTGPFNQRAISHRSTHRSYRIDPLQKWVPSLFHPFSSHFRPVLCWHTLLCVKCGNLRLGCLEKKAYSCPFWVVQIGSKKVSFWRGEQNNTFCAKPIWDSAKPVRWKVHIMWPVACSKTLYLCVTPFTPIFAHFRSIRGLRSDPRSILSILPLDLQEP